MCADVEILEVLSALKNIVPEDGEIKATTAEETYQRSDDFNRRQSKT